MALIIKFAKPKHTDRFPTWDYSNKDAVAKCVWYIHNGMSNLPEEEQLFGFIGTPAGASIEQLFLFFCNNHCYSPLIFYCCFLR